SAQTTPGMIVSNNGTELTSNAVLSWCGEIGAEWHYIAPGKPMQNDYVERLASPPFGSTAACATSYSMRRSSSAWITLAPRSPRGWKTITASDRTQPLDTKPRRRSPPNCKSNGLLRYALRARCAAHCFNRAHAQNIRLALIPAGGNWGHINPAGSPRGDTADNSQLHHPSDTI